MTPAPPRDRLSIEVVGGAGPVAELPQSGRLVIGSSPERAGLLLEGQGVEPVHCTIGRLKGGAGWALKDLGSEFGTLVNGKRVDSSRLRHGDTILVGSRRLRVFDPARGPHSDPAARDGASPPAARASRGTRPPETLPAVPGYRLVRPIGRGAMGDVYLAVQESLQREVALKILAPRLAADSDFVARFQAEARAAAALNHPNVVHAYDVGEYDGLHYLSMEYMDRGCLETRVARDGPLPWREVVSALADAARGLVYAESRGLVHRDIKPANLMQNHAGATKIADLGLAAGIEEEETQEGRRVVGTPHFLAPELIRGARADARSDLYSLGATAYRLLTGRTPFEGATPKEILRSALRDEPRAPREWDPGLPLALSDLVTSLLAKDPDHRPRSASALLAALEDLGAPAQPSTQRRSPVLRAATAILALAALGAASWLALGTLRDRPAGEVEPVTATRDGTAEPAGPPESTPPANPPLPEAFEPPPLEEPPGPEPGEMAERLLEAEAQVAYLQLGERSLSDAERTERLRALAEHYKGTDTAARASAEADRVAAERTAAEAERDATRAAVDAELAVLRAAAALDTTPPRPGEALRAMRAVPGPDALAADERFVRERANLEAAVLERARAWAIQRLAAADERAAEGDFDGEREELVAIDFDFGELEGEGEGESPAGVAALLELEERARARLASAGERRATFETERRAADARRLARALGLRSGLLTELRSLSLDAARGRVADARDAVFADDMRAHLADLERDLALAAQVLETLAHAWDQGLWRRRSLADPRPDRPASTEALGVDERGVLVETNGVTEHVPWSVFASEPRALHVLFNGRLTRDWTDAERRGIATLMRISAVAHTVEGVSKVLDPSSSAQFSQREAEGLVQRYDEAASWAPEGERDDFRRERAAAELLSRALVEASEERFDLAVARLERLLEESGDTLLVALLSDGSIWRAESSEAVPSDSTEAAPGGRATAGAAPPDDEG